MNFGIQVTFSHISGGKLWSFIRFNESLLVCSIYIYDILVFTVNYSEGSECVLIIVLTN
jgi:hypothetical protein